MLSQIICSVFPGDKKEKKKKSGCKIRNPRPVNCVSGMQSKIAGQKVQRYIYLQATNPQGKSCAARSNAFVNFITPLTPAGCPVLA